jgi:hypothetical protein
MNRKEFLSLLKESKNNFKWYLDFGSIRGKRRKGRLDYCPLAAACVAKTGKRTDPLNAYNAFKKLDGKKTETFNDDAIVKAADYGSDCFYDPSVKKLRKEMLKALGLVE